VYLAARGDLDHFAGRLVMTLVTATPALCALPRISDDATWTIRRQMAMRSCKWDPQVGDVAVLAPLALQISPEALCELIRGAELLAGELVQAEAELVSRPDLHRQLGIPRAIRRILADDILPTPAAARVLRFDFHATDDGWRISEVNSDVPGGFTESSSLAAIMAKHYPGFAPTGNPADRWADVLAESIRPEGHIALLSAPGYMEDLQIMAYLRILLELRGCRATLARPESIRWDQGSASIRCADHSATPLDAIIRFYQAEWLARLPVKNQWRYFFRGGHTPVGNPGTAILTESKRFPLIWSALATALPTWRKYLPQTCDPRDAPWRTDDRWLVKSAYCNTGDTVAFRDQLTPRDWQRFARAITWNPTGWVAQQRFCTLPVETDLGPMYPCVGVYTINGKFSGIYGRMSPKPLIDFSAMDVAVLKRVEDESNP
jgi:hypothetical protein